MNLRVKYKSSFPKEKIYFCFVLQNREGTQSYHPKFKRRELVYYKNKYFIIAPAMSSDFVYKSNVLIMIGLKDFLFLEYII